MRHEPPLAFPSFVRQYYNYGRGAVRFYRSAGRAWRSEAAQQRGLYRRLVTGLPNHLADQPAGRVQLLSLLVLWQLANTAGAVREIVRRR